jgi:mannose-6-phosphate isomerase
VELPDGRGLPLASLIQAFPDAMLGAAHVSRHGPVLGVLCKLLDSAMRLFIQAHPDRSFARRHLGSAFGKTESWIVVSTRSIAGEEPYILFGFKSGVTEADFRQAARAQDTAALVDALNRVRVGPGDVWLLTGGTPHALGPGVFLVEIQEPTDLVVNVEHRLFGRTEEQAYMGLGFDAAMRCFNYEAAGQAFLDAHRLTPRSLTDQPDAREEVLIGPDHTPYFGASRLTVTGTTGDRDRGRCYIGIVLSGRGTIEGAAAPAHIAAGTTFFIPAASEHRAYRATAGPLTIIKCFPPAAGA